MLSHSARALQFLIAALETSLVEGDRPRVVSTCIPRHYALLARLSHLRHATAGWQKRAMYICTFEATLWTSSASNATAPSVHPAVPFFVMPYKTNALYTCFEFAEMRRVGNTGNIPGIYVVRVQWTCI
ncbi:hypothetical protein BKA82DRAFT_2464284 [Pisolithus tinctorius]|nr:hypothetical protein BKA82DRAFT_2464284 [Pisolithus tinctorius]